MTRGMPMLIGLGMAVVLAVPSAAWTRFRNIKPEKAVIAAAKVGPEGVGGIFEMVVRGTGHQGGHFYLNSESDYRDQRNLTIAMSDETGAAIERKIGAETDDALIGRKIFVRGVAHRVKISFTVDGRATDKYYYQTHVVVTTPVQVAVRDKL